MAKISNELEINRVLKEELIKKLNLKTMFTKASNNKDITKSLICPNSLTAEIRQTLSTRNYAKNWKLKKFSNNCFKSVEKVFKTTKPHRKLKDASLKNTQSLKLSINVPFRYKHSKTPSDAFVLPKINMNTVKLTTKNLKQKVGMDEKNSAEIGPKELIEVTKERHSKMNKMLKRYSVFLKQNNEMFEKIRMKKYEEESNELVLEMKKLREKQ